MTNNRIILQAVGGVLIAIALAMTVWVIVGKLVAPAGTPGAMDTLSGPACGVAAVGLVFMALAEWRSEQD